MSFTKHFHKWGNLSNLCPIWRKDKNEAKKEEEEEGEEEEEEYINYQYVLRTLHTILEKTPRTPSIRPYAFRSW